MSKFKAKMHQIRLRLGLRPRPHSGNLQRYPDPLAGFKGTIHKGREGKGGKGGEMEGPTYKWREVKGGRGWGKRKGGKMTEGEGKGNGGAYL